MIVIFWYLTLGYIEIVQYRAIVKVVLVSNLWFFVNYVHIHAFSMN